MYNFFFLAFILCLVVSLPLWCRNGGDIAGLKCHIFSSSSSPQCQWDWGAFDSMTLLSGVISHLPARIWAVLGRTCPAVLCIYPALHREKSKSPLFPGYKWLQWLVHYSLEYLSYWILFSSNPDQDINCFSQTIGDGEGGKRKNLLNDCSYYELSLVLWCCTISVGTSPWQPLKILTFEAWKYAPPPHPPSPLPNTHKQNFGHLWPSTYDIDLWPWSVFHDLMTWAPMLHLTDRPTHISCLSEAISSEWHKVQMSLVARKHVFGVCDQGWLKLACSATETS